MPASPRRPILVVGESLVDVVTHADGTRHEHAGGSPANVAVALARLGAPTELATAYADDRLGRLLDTHLQAAGVALAGDPHILSRTSTAAARLDRSGAAAYDFDLDGELAEPIPTAPPLLVHTGSLAAVLEPGASTVAATVARLSGVATVSYDINARPAATGAGPDLVRRVEALVAATDIVKASDEDLATLYPGRETAACAHHLLGLGAGAVVVTWGGHGASCFSERGRVDSPAQDVRVEDTIGAGDSFCAATLDGLRRLGLLGAERRGELRALSLEGWSGVLERAGRAAAITVSRPGADPPTCLELDGAVRA